MCVSVCMGWRSGRAICYKTWPPFLNKAVGLLWFPIEDGVGGNYKTFLVQKPIRTILLVPSLKNKQTNSWIGYQAEMFFYQILI